MYKTVKYIFAAFLIAAIVVAVLAAVGVSTLVIPNAPYLIATLILLALIVIGTTLLKNEGCRCLSGKCCGGELTPCVKLISAIALIAVILAIVISSEALLTLTVSLLGIFALLFVGLTMVFAVISDNCR